MAMMFEVGADELTLPKGTYIFRLKDISEDTEPPKFGNKKRNKWTFLVDDVEDVADDSLTDKDIDDLIGREILQWATQSMAPNSTQYQWLCGMLNRDTLSKGDKIDSSELVGKLFKVNWGSKSYSIRETGETGTKTTILAISPYRPRPARTAPQREERTRSVERGEDEAF